MCSLKWNLSSRVAEVWMLYGWGCHSGWFVVAGPWKSGQLANPIITIVINKSNHSLKEQKRRWFCFYCGQAPTHASAVKCVFKNSINSTFILELQKLRGDNSSIKVIPPGLLVGKSKGKIYIEYLYIHGIYLSRLSGTGATDLKKLESPSKNSLKDWNGRTFCRSHAVLNRFAF